MKYRQAKGDRLGLLARGAMIFALLAVGCGHAAAQRDRSMRTVSQYPIVGDDGQRVANHPVADAPELVRSCARAVLEYRAVKCHPPRTACTTGSHASRFGLNRRGRV